MLASQELDDESAEKRPSVQIGDPFTGKKLIEASVELVQGGLVESLQDCGAAGLASSLSEMAADYGIDVHLDRVPLREAEMEPWEIMVSESQERMVAIVRPPMIEAVEAVLDRWELHHAVIGDVTSTGELRAFWDGDVVGEIPARLLTDECPRYDLALEPRAPSPEREIEDAPARRATRCSSSWRRRTSAAATSSFAGTTSSSAREPCGGRGSTLPSSGSAPRCEGSQCRSTARVGSRSSTRSWAARSRSSRLPATSPAQGASRWD